MSAKNILQAFEQYQKSRLAFAVNISDLASWQSNIKCLESSDVVELLVPLIDDKVVGIRRAAALAASRLADRSPVLAGKMVASPMLISLLKQLSQADVFFKRSVMQFIRGLSKHSEDMASEVTSAGVLPHLVSCLEDFDTQVKENAAWALGLIGRQSDVLAASVVDAGALPLLVLCLQQPELSLKQITAGVLEDLAQFQAQAIVDAGALSHLMLVSENAEPKLKRCALEAIGEISVHSEQLAETVVAAGAIQLALLSPSAISARLLRNIVKHSPDLAQLAVNEGACGMLVQLLGNVEDTGCEPNSQQPINLSAATPAAAALGYIAAQSDQLALAVIASKAVPLLVGVLCAAMKKEQPSGLQKQEPEGERWRRVCASAWALGHIARHSPHHSEAVAAAGAFPILLQFWENELAGEEVRARCSCALRQALQCCLHRPALESMLHTCKSPILESVLSQYTKILPQDPRARRIFVTTGALRRVQELPAEEGSLLQRLVSVINSCFPEEIVRYYSPGYPDTLLERVEQYTPQVPELFIQAGQISECPSVLTTQPEKTNDPPPTSLKTKK